MSKEDEKAISILQKNTIQRLDNHYETALLWRNENIALPNSLDMAKKRFLYLEKRLNSDENLKKIFYNTILEYKDKGYITNIGKLKSVPTTMSKVWYLTIFPVVNRNKPGKTRIVWDAAAKANGISLNSLLMKGPDLLSSLPSIIYRFREKAVAISGDIEQMFHQIFMRKSDRDVQRFLWRTDENDEEPDIYVMNVMLFGASCAPCTSQYVKNMHALKFEEQYPVASAAIKYNHYVDDFLGSVDTSEEAITLASQVKYIHAKAGFNIRNWLCNRADILNALNETKFKNENKNFILDSNTGVDKVLGIFWKPINDVI